MKRRDFIAGLGGAAVVGSRGAWGQQAMPVVGFLAGVSPEAYVARLRSFRQGLSEAGYVEGQSVAIEYRWANDQYSRLPDLASDLIGRRVAVIATAGTAATLAVKAATALIPTVFVLGADPVGSGIVTNLKNPGGNLTGVTNLDVELGAKRLELLQQLLPIAKTIAVLVNSSSPNVEQVSQDIRAAAQKLGMNVIVLRAHTERELAPAFTDMVKQGAEGLVIGSDAFFNSESKRLAALATQHRVPAIFQFQDFAAAGGLMSYGGNITDAYRLAGVYVGRILKGEMPSDLPVLQTTKVELIINLKTTNALGINVPLSLLGRADEVIE